jgi:hypothetical protein
MLLAHATWREVEAYLIRSRGIVVPIGSTEQHGPSGLIGTDGICAEAVAWGIGEGADALVGPTISLGANQFNLAFPGTISLRATTLMALVTDYVESLADQGFRRFYVMNGHGGNVAPVRAAFHDLHGSHGGLHLRLRSWWELPSANALRLAGCGNKGIADCIYVDANVKWSRERGGAGRGCPVRPRCGALEAESGHDQAAASSLGRRMRLQAAAVRVNSQPTRAVPRCRVLRRPPTVLIQPKTSSIRLRTRWLTP